MNTSVPGISDRPDIFVRATGQADNIGDSLLRRAMLNAFRPAGTLHVLVRSLPESYIQGLRIQPPDFLYRDEDEWLRAARAASKKRTTLFAFNAGEIQISRYYATQYLKYLLTVSAARRSGGFGIQLGTGVREGRKMWKPFISHALRHLRMVYWRDSYSREVMGTGFIMPDWAFIEGNSDEWLRSQLNEAPRNYVAISMRGDRAHPSKEWFEHVRLLASQLGCSIVVVAQVASDRERAQHISNELGGRFLEIDHHRSHYEQESEVRNLYRESALVVSDRLHALIIGATEGAVPYGLVDGGSEKVRRHFDTVGMKSVCVQPLRDPAAFDLNVRLAELVDRVVDARARIVDVSAELRQELSNQKRPHVEPRE